MLEYFGEQMTERCGNCSNCNSEMVETDITTEAQKILSGVARVEKRWPGGLGEVAVVQMLRGSRDQNTLKRGLDSLPTYGILKEVPQQRLRQYFDALEEQGYLINTKGEYPVLHLGAKAVEVLFHGQSVTMTERRAPGSREEQAGRRQSGQKRSERAAALSDEGLIGVLKAERSRLAQKNKVPAYIIFNNLTLDAMAQKKPRTMGDFMRLPGVGDAKAHKYGKDFLKCIAQYCAEHPDEE